jgi:hypothetical protein
MKKPPTNSSKSGTKHTTKRDIILQAKSENPNLTTREIGKIANVDHSHVVRTLQAYGIDHGAVESYQKHRADILDGLAHRIIASITDSDIKAASFLQRLSAYGIIYDKMRIERGLSDSASKPMVQINIVSPNTQVVAQSVQSKVVEQNNINTIVDIQANVK